MRVLIVTNMYPTPGRPVDGIFVQEQVRALRAAGLEPHVIWSRRDLAVIAATRPPRRG